MRTFVLVFAGWLTAVGGEVPVVVDWLLDEALVKIDKKLSDSENGALSLGDIKFSRDNKTVFMAKNATFGDLSTMKRADVALLWSTNRKVHFKGSVTFSLCAIITPELTIDGIVGKDGLIVIDDNVLNFYFKAILNHKSTCKMMQKRVTWTKIGNVRVYSSNKKMNNILLDVPKDILKQINKAPFMNAFLDFYSQEFTLCISPEQFKI